MKAALVYSEELTGYSFGATHPMGPERVHFAVELARSLGVLDHLELVPPRDADDALVELAHEPDYIAAVQAERVNPDHGLGTEDNPTFPGMHQISSHICTASVTAAELVWSGRADRAINIAGGLHHAMPRSASGFCIYNDVVSAIRWLQQQGAKKIAYLDTDAHHGDGVQHAFYNDPSVLTISLHESPVYLFPGTGFPSESGGREAPGSAVNIALPATCGDEAWLRAFDAVVPDVLGAFEPDILITQHGCDAHRADPLTDLQLSLDGLLASYHRVADLATRYAGGRWVALGGGGYNLNDVVGRAWAHLLGVFAGHPIAPDAAIPESWKELLGGDTPSTMTDGATVRPDPIEWGFNPSDRIDQAIIATRRAVYPELGLDPGF